MFAQLPDEDCAGERAATPKGQLSPLFAGKAKGMVASVTTLGTPNNGTPAMEPGLYSDVRFFETTYFLVGMAGTLFRPVEMFWPMRLNQFGISSKTFWRDPLRVSLKSFDFIVNEKDSAKWDCSIDGAAEMNQKISCQEDIYYFCYSFCTTKDDGRGGQIPTPGTWFMLRGAAANIGQRRKAGSFVTKGGYVIKNKDWLPNDGMVSVLSSRHPFGEPFRKHNPKDIRPGVWNEMPIIHGWDHMDIGGGFKEIGGKPGLREFYLGILEILAPIK